MIQKSAVPVGRALVFAFKMAANSDSVDYRRINHPFRPVNPSHRILEHLRPTLLGVDVDLDPIKKVPPRGIKIHETAWRLGPQMGDDCWESVLSSSLELLLILRTFESSRVAMNVIHDIPLEPFDKF